MLLNHFTVYCQYDNKFKQTYYNDIHHAYFYRFYLSQTNLTTLRIFAFAMLLTSHLTLLSNCLIRALFMSSRH